MNLRKLSTMLGMVIVAGTMAQAAVDELQPVPASITPGVERPKNPAVPAPAQSEEPGPQHKWLKNFEGEWQTVIRTFGADGKELSRDTGSATGKITMNGRFLAVECTGQISGKLYNASGILGYNNAAQRFESVWTDSRSTSMVMTAGQLNKRGRVLALEGEGVRADGSKFARKWTISTLPIDAWMVQWCEEDCRTIDGKLGKRTEIMFSKGKVDIRFKDLPAIDVPAIPELPVKKPGG